MLSCTINEKGQIETTHRGHGLLERAKLNKGTAFTHEERLALDLIGLLPHQIELMDEQLDRCYAHFSQLQDDMHKNIYLNHLHDENEVLFYALLMNHINEMLPIVYTPTVGDAVKEFSLEFQKMRGLFISYPNRDYMEEMLKGRINEEVDLILVTDGEAVLGIGDWGTGGMHISIGKLMVYTACGGLNPNRVLPIQLDVGTNNKALLEDNRYLGWRHERIEGDAYDAFIDDFVRCVHKIFPNVFLHWEDFGLRNARANLKRYREKLLTFNDDMQGTGATALACLLSALSATGGKLTEQRIVFLGGGTAGCGIADQFVLAMADEGLSLADAQERILIVDRAGLLVDDNPDLVECQEPYAVKRDLVKDWVVNAADNITLEETVKHYQPTVLVGCSTATGAFTESIVKEMAGYMEHPIIFPLSNPTARSEATAEDLLRWTEGRAMIAMGSPFDPVEINGKKVRISQSNNAFVFPGIGVGAIAVKAKHVSDGMIRAACDALAACSPANTDKSAPLLPDIADAQVSSFQIALAVAGKAIEEGLAEAPSEPLENIIKKVQWKPEYHEVVPASG